MADKVIAREKGVKTALMFVLIVIALDAGVTGI